MKVTIENMDGESRGVKRRSVTIIDSESSGQVGGPALDKRAYCPPSAIIPNPEGSTLVELLEKNYKMKRPEIIQEDGMIITPLKVMKDVAFDFGSPLEIQTFEIHLPAQKDKPGRILHRVGITMGNYTGDGETPRYRLALQIAAADLLEKLKRDNHVLPAYGLLPGSRVSPLVYRDLKDLCDMEQLASKPTYARMRSKDAGSSLIFTFKCMVGQAETIGTSDSIFLAKRLAAKKMYEELTGEIYPNESVSTGASCIHHDDFRDMGINPVVSVRTIKRLQRIYSTDRVERTAESSNMGINEDMYDDEFAEDEDNIVVMGTQLECIRLE